MVANSEPKCYPYCRTLGRTNYSAIRIPDTCSNIVANCGPKCHAHSHSLCDTHRCAHSVTDG
jgi:hypothetical protein